MGTHHSIDMGTTPKVKNIYETTSIYPKAEDYSN